MGVKYGERGGRESPLRQKVASSEKRILIKKLGVTLVLCKTVTGDLDHSRITCGSNELCKDVSFLNNFTTKEWSTLLFRASCNVEW